VSIENILEAPGQLLGGWFRALTMLCQRLAPIRSGRAAIAYDTVVNLREHEGRFHL
jgi:hypothetical protein